MAFETICLVGIPNGIRVSPVGFLVPLPGNSMPAPRRCHYRFSSTASHAPAASLGHPGFFPGCQGFILRSVTRHLRPSLISTIRESATLWPLPASGSPNRVRFSETYRSIQFQARRASLGKTQYLPIYRPTSLRFGSPDIRSRSPTPARPPPLCHIVGSLFATYTGSASCFLQTAHF
jgi:hypothetical protein